MENNTMNKVMAVLLALVVQAAFAQATWNGKADTRWYVKSAKEFTINTAEELAGFAKLVNEGKNFKGQAVKLGENIWLNDADDTNWKNWENNPPANKWTPIGKYSDGSIDNSFRGTFDGNGKVITGVYINSANDYQGLFGYVSSGGKIKRLVVSYSNIKGRDHVGGLVGSNSGGEITYCYFFEGVVIGIDYVGLLVGSNRGAIAASYSVGTVAGNDFIGGFLGYNYAGGKIGFSYSNNITVTGSGTAAGGFIGENKGDIGFSYSSGNVTGEGLVGGFAGENSGTIACSYSTSAVIGKYVIGGFVGHNENLIITSYSIGVVTGKGKESSLVGGFVGSNDEKGDIDRSYYNKQTSKQSDSGKGDGKTTAQLKQKATFVGWDFKKVWDIKSTINDGYPHLLDLLEHYVN
jgi:hypothetical protein